MDVSRSSIIEDCM